MHLLSLKVKRLFPEVPLCTVDEAEAAKRDERMIAERADWGGIPINTDVAHLGSGVWAKGSPHGGELAKQGIVEC